MIEHLRSPSDALARLRSLLAPGGVLWLALPDAGSAVARALGRRWWSVIPTHTQYFTRGSLAGLLNRGGFEVLDVATAPKAFTVSYYLGRVGGYSPAAGRALQRAAGATGVADRIWAPDVRDRMAVLARGPAGGRNDGWRIAHAPLVAFTGDDCEPTPAWLAEALAVAGGVPGAIVQGPTLPNPAEGVRRGVFSRSVTVSRLGPSYETCNIFYPRIVLERLGGFDETFGSVPAGEDTDLAWRAIESGVQTAFAPGALVLHAVHELDARGMLREATRWSETPRVLARHPGARALLSRGVFWNGWHYCLVRSAVALALPAPIRRVLLTHHALQLVARARTAGSGPWAAPILLAYDAVETAALVRGSIRYRTLVL